MCGQFLAVLAAVLLGACAIQRAHVAQEARVQMIGLKKEQVLACMGPPTVKSAEGATEVWSYNSGNGTVISSANVTGDRFGATGVGVSSRRFCTVNIVISRGEVAVVNYSGPTGGLLTAGEQCAFAIENCGRGQ